jgi:hypothetical protein
MQTAPGLALGRFQMETPSWAQQMLESDCARFAVKVPKLEWWWDPEMAVEVEEMSWKQVGKYDFQPRRRITVYNGGDKMESKMNQLHELAHHIQHEQTGDSNHDDAFWRICWGLYRWHRIPLALAVYSEFTYMAGSERVLRSMGFEMSKEVEVAAALGAATRRKKWLAIQIRRLKARLEMTHKQREEQSIKRQVRVLKAKHKVEAKVVAKKMPAYKRSMMKRK